MQYLNKSFTLPVSSKRITQTDYEIAVGLRHPNGRLVQPKTSRKTGFSEEPAMQGQTENGGERER